MGFVSYSRVYYQEKLHEYESYGNGASSAAVREAKILLKVLEDIRDEGYTYAYNAFSAEFDCIRRLRAFIVQNGEKPFEMVSFSLLPQPHYANATTDLSTFLAALESRMSGDGPVLPDIPPIYHDILAYSKRLFSKADRDTAYVFLLRDALLPYFAFKCWDKEHRLALYPFLIGRKYLSLFPPANSGGGAGDGGAPYDALHEAIFNGLLDSPGDFHALRRSVMEPLQTELRAYPQLISSLSGLLSQIPQKKIMVIESGYIGSMPLLLSCFDDRVDFMLFTTIPCLYQAYKGKYYTDAFEKIRLFETIQCQDALFALSAMNGSRFLVRKTDNKEIIERASMELRTWRTLLV